LLVLLAAPSAAHHSPVAFKTDVTDFTIKGAIEHVDVRNPHSVMDVRVTDRDGSATLWHIEFSSVNLLLRRGWDFERLKVGEEVTCTGNPSASGKTEMYMWSITLADGTEFGR
jgi:outer membrane usher protein FimD/PapC